MMIVGHLAADSAYLAIYSLHLMIPPLALDAAGHSPWTPDAILIISVCTVRVSMRASVKGIDLINVVDMMPACRVLAGELLEMWLGRKSSSGIPLPHVLC